MVNEELKQLQACLINNTDVEQAENKGSVVCKEVPYISFNNRYIFSGQFSLKIYYGPSPVPSLFQFESTHSLFALEGHSPQCGTYDEDCYGLPQQPPSQT